MATHVNDISKGAGFAIVIGGGGAVAAASCCGALRAVRDVGGIDVHSARVMIGTSAGAAVATELCLGRSLDEIADGLRRHGAAGGANTMSAAWKSKPELVRRVVGSSYVMTQVALRGVWRMSKPWPSVQRAFPASLVSTGNDQWLAHFPEDWPEAALWLVACDLDTGQRVVLKGANHGAVSVPLPKAIRASCAVPGVFAPVRVGSHRLVDGGVHSPTNLDVALQTGCHAVIALAPMGYDRREPPDYLRAVGRLRANTKLNQEVAMVRKRGMAVLAIRPGAEELRFHKLNIMSGEGNENIMRAAYETTARRLDAGVGHDVLEQIRTGDLASSS